MSKRVAVAALLAAGLVGGCTKQSQHASMGLVQSEEPQIELGAGDALGRDLHVTALVLAVREMQARQAWALLLDPGPAAPIDPVIGRLTAAPTGAN